MKGNLTGTEALFYSAITLILVTSIAAIPYIGSLELYFSIFGIPVIVIITAFLVGSVFIQTRRSLYRHSGSYGTTRGNKIPQVQSISLGILSSTFASILIYTLLGKFYLLLFTIILVPFEIPLLMLEEKFADFNRIRKGAAAASFAVIVLLFLFTLSALFNPVLYISGVAIYSLMRTFILTEPRERIRQNGYSSATALISPAYLGSLTLVFSSLHSSGYAVTIVILAILMIFVSMMIVMRRRRVPSSILFVLLFLSTVFAIIFTIRNYQLEYAVTLSALFATSAYMMFYDLLDSKFHNIWKSIRLLPKGVFAPLFIFFSAAGLVNVSGFSSLTLSALYPGTQFSDFSQIFMMVFLVSILLLITITGSRIFNPVAFIVLCALFINGIYSIVSLNFDGIWTPGYLEAAILTVVVSGFVLYEPAFRFARSYSTKVPTTLSISHRLGITHYLHSRYDVNLEKNKKSNKDLLGSGGFAYVFRGKDMATGETVVIKTPRVYDEEGKTESQKKEFLQDSVKQLRSEKDVLSSLHHPTIVRFIDYFKEGNEYYLVEEYAEGRTIDSFLSTGTKAGVKFDEQKVLSISRRLLFALNYMHMHEVFHRDLNPGNVLITKTGPKIIDFGTSKSMIGKGTRSFFAHSERIGVPCYNPPELEIGTSIEASPSYDTYSIGAIMCSLLTGSFLDGDQIMVKYGSRFITDRYLKEEIEDKLSGNIFVILRKMLAFRPEDRFESVVAVIAELFDLSGEMLITHMGDTYVLDRQTRYSVILSGDNSLYVPEGRIIRDNEIFIYEYGRTDPVKWGEIYYDGIQRGYYFKAEPKKGIFGKNAHITSSRQQIIEMKSQYIYTSQQDVGSGAFSFYVRRT